MQWLNFVYLILNNKLYNQVLYTLHRSSFYVLLFEEDFQEKLDDSHGPEFKDKQAMELQMILVYY